MAGGQAAEEGICKGGPEGRHEAVYELYLMLQATQAHIIIAICFMKEFLMA